MLLFAFELMLVSGFLIMIYGLRLISEPLAVLASGLLLVVLSLVQISLLKRQKPDA